MESERSGSPLYKIVAFATATLMVALAVAAFVRYGPGLSHETPGRRLVAALEQHFPASHPTVTRSGAATLSLSLEVAFDPTVDAAQAQATFQRALGIAEAQALSDVKEVEVELKGTSLEGGATSASRTFGYAAGRRDLGPKTQENTGD
jgi:hypothetical protein